MIIEVGYMDSSVASLPLNDNLQLMHYQIGEPAPMFT